MLIRKVLGLTVLGGLALSLPSPALARAAVPKASSAGLTLPGDAIDLNTATSAELAGLPGMGAAYAKRVVEGRPYSAKNQLVTRGVLPASTYEEIKDRVVAHRPPK